MSPVAQVHERGSLTSAADACVVRDRQWKFEFACSEGVLGDEHRTAILKYREVGLAIEGKGQQTGAISRQGPTDRVLVAYRAAIIDDDLKSAGIDGQGAGQPLATAGAQINFLFDREAGTGLRTTRLQGRAERHGDGRENGLCHKTRGSVLMAMVLIAGR